MNQHPNIHLLLLLSETTTYPFPARTTFTAGTTPIGAPTGSSLPSGEASKNVLEAPATFCALTLSAFLSADILGIFTTLGYTMSKGSTDDTALR
jgi:hypothetical protein